MNKSGNGADTPGVLDDDILDAIGGSLAAAEPDADRVARLRARIAAELDQEPLQQGLFTTIREADGDWIQLQPLVEMKILQRDVERNLDTYLLRLRPGGSVPQHGHAADELCYVVAGDVAFGDISLQTGDYHYAAAGSVHGAASSVHGALLLLQSRPVEAAPP